MKCDNHLLDFVTDESVSQFICIFQCFYAQFNEINNKFVTTLKTAVFRRCRNSLISIVTIVKSSVK